MVINKVWSCLGVKRGKSGSQSIFLFFLFFAFTLFLPIKSKALFCKRDGKFLGWEDFSPELIKKKYHVEFLGYVGFLCRSFEFS